MQRSFLVHANFSLSTNIVSGSNNLNSSNFQRLISSLVIRSRIWKSRLYSFCDLPAQNQFCKHLFHQTGRQRIEVAVHLEPNSQPKNNYLIIKALFKNNNEYYTWSWSKLNISRNAEHWEWSDVNLKYRVVQRTSAAEMSNWWNHSWLLQKVIYRLFEKTNS